MPRDEKTIPMPEYGICDIKTRVTFIPTRFEHESPAEALERGRKEGEQTLNNLVKLLARQVAREQFDASKLGKNQIDDRVDSDRSESSSPVL